MERCTLCYGDTRGECIRAKRCLYEKRKPWYRGMPGYVYVVAGFAFANIINAIAILVDYYA